MTNSAAVGPWRLLWWFTRARWWLAVTIGVLGCVEMVPTSLLPLVLGSAIDNGISDGNLRALGARLALVLALGLAMAVGAALGNYLSSLLWLHATTAAERIVHEHAARVGGALSNRVRAGEVATVGTTDVFSIGTPIEGSGRLIGALASFAVVAVVQFDSSPLLTTVVLIGVPVAVLGIGPLVRPLIAREEKQREHVGDAAVMAADIVAGLRILRGIGGERVFGERFAATSQRVREAGVAAGRLESWLSAAETFLPGLVTVAITWLGARLVLGGELSVGELFSFYAVAAYLVVPVAVTTEAIEGLTVGLVAARRMGRVLAVQPEPVRPAHPVALPRGQLEITDETTGVVLRSGKLTVIDTGLSASRIGERIAGGSGAVSASG